MKTSVGPSLPLLLVACMFALTQGAEAPWPAGSEHRIVVQVDPLPEILRSPDETVARLAVDFDAWLGDRVCDLSTLRVMRYDPQTGRVLPAGGGTGALPASSTLPVRFYDDAIPWDYPEREGYAHNNNGTGLPLRRMPGGGRFMGVTGSGRRGQIVWAHTQEKQLPSFYAITFNSRDADSEPRPEPAGFVGDGSNRCTSPASHFFPLYHSRVEVADFDGDGLFDLIVGNMVGTIQFYRNYGAPGRPRFSVATLLHTDDGEPLDIGYSSAPKAVDWDGDGDLDLIVGAEKESFVLFRNTGTLRQWRLHHEGLVHADGKPLRVPPSPCEEDPENKTFVYDYYPIPEVVDWDGDGDLDLLAGGNITGRIWLYENITRDRAADPRLTFKGALQADGKDIDVTWMASPTAADFDGDGDLDLISGAMQIKHGGDHHDPDKFLWYYENIGTRTRPALALRPFPSKGSFRHGALGTPRVIDFNGDGLPDLVVSAAMDLLLIPNVGSSERPLFDAAVPDLPGVQGNDSLGFQQLIDYNADGWPDLFRGSEVSLNDGKGMPGTFSKAVRLEGAERIDHTTPSGDHGDSRILADMDGDGAFDVLIGDHPGHVWLHRNLGTNESPRFTQENGEQLRVAGGGLVSVELVEANNFDKLQGARTMMTAGDFNRDGARDLVVCNTEGFIRLFVRQPGDPIVFEEPQILARLHNIRLVAQAIDWNGDGWDDVLATYAGGQTYLFENRAESGSARFHDPRMLQLPEFNCSWPLLYVGDWNRDGDVDILFNYGTMTRFVEKSFALHGYAPAKAIRFESRPDGQSSR